MLGRHGSSASTPPRPRSASNSSVSMLLGGFLDSPSSPSAICSSRLARCSPSPPSSLLLGLLVAVLRSSSLVVLACPRPRRRALLGELERAQADRARAGRSSPGPRRASSSSSSDLAGALLDERPPQLDQRPRVLGRRMARSAARAPASASASSSGASARSVITAKRPWLYWSSILAVEVLAPCRACGWRRAPRRARARPPRTRRARRRRGREPRVQLDVVAGGRQRQAVGPAADDGDLALRGHARGLGQRDVLARRAPACRREADLDLVVAGDRAHGEAERALQRLGRGFLALGSGWPRRMRYEIRRNQLSRSSDQLSATLAALSGSSSPKQRW